MEKFLHKINTNQRVILVIGILSFISAVFGWFYTLSSNASGFAFSFFPLGIFTWDDGMVIGTFLCIVCFFLWKKNNSVYTGLVFSLYMVIRTAGETLYNLNAQFSPMSRPWESWLPNMMAFFHLRLLELFVIAQVSFMVLCVTSVLIFLFYLKKYLFKV